MPVADYIDKAFIDFSPYEDECEVRCSTVKIVVTRKPQLCMGNPFLADIRMERPETHEIPAGTRCRCESAMVEGEWGRYYTCLECIASYLDHPDQEYFENLNEYKVA